MTTDPDDVHTSTCDGGPFHPGPCDVASPQPDTAPEDDLPTARWLEQWCVENRGWKPQDHLWQEWDDGLDAIRAWRALNGAPATPAEWPKWLTPEHTNIHTAIENAMKQALAHCYGSADASGYAWTMEGLFSVAANSIMGVLRGAGCPPPAVGDVDAIPMPEDTWLVDEDESDEEAPATPAERAVIDAATPVGSWWSTTPWAMPPLTLLDDLADAVARLRSERNKNDG